MIAQAPVTFAAGVLVAAAMMYAAARWRYAGTIASLEERLKLRDDRVAEYERKLQGATPDQAKATIEELERKINALGPRRIGPEQRQKMTATISSLRGSRVAIAADGASSDAPNIARALGSAFANAGWAVQSSMVLALGNPPPSGVGIAVKNPNSLTQIEAVVTQAFRDAGVEFDLQHSPELSGLSVRPPFDVEVIITNRLLD